MAAFSYAGKARIQWGRGLADSVHEITWEPDTDRLTVEPLPNRRTGEPVPPHPSIAWEPYTGTMAEHPAAHMVFLHC